MAVSRTSTSSCRGRPQGRCSTRPGAGHVQEPPTPPCVVYYRDPSESAAMLRRVAFALESALHLSYTPEGAPQQQQQGRPGQSKRQRVLGCSLVRAKDLYGYYPVRGPWDISGRALSPRCMPFLSCFVFPFLFKTRGRRSPRFSSRSSSSTLATCQGRLRLCWQALSWAPSFSLTSRTSRTSSSSRQAMSNAWHGQPS